MVPQDSDGTPEPTLPASSIAVRRLLLVNSAQQVPSAQVDFRSSFREPEVPEVAVAEEAGDAVSDTVSVEHESDLRSIVPSEASIEFADDPGIHQAAITRGFSAGLVQLDGFHVTEIFERRAHVMGVVPHFMRAAFSSAMKAACEGILSGFSVGDLILQERAWKSLPSPSDACCVDPIEEDMSPRRNLSKGWQCSIRGIGRSWFCTASACLNKHPRIWCEEAASTIQTLWRPELFGPRDSSSWERFLQVSKHLRVHVSHQARLQTLRALTSPERRPPVPREPILPHLASAVPESPFDLDFDRFVKHQVLREEEQCQGPSGLTTEHLQPILENDSSLTALFRVGVLFSRGHVPPGVLEAVRLGRITALAKPDDGIRGIVVGDVLRRVVAKTIAQQIGDQVEKSTVPFQFALKTKAGSECVAHTLRTLSELDEATTILSVDGVGAFDLISRLRHDARSRRHA